MLVLWLSGIISIRSEDCRTFGSRIPQSHLGGLPVFFREKLPSFLAYARVPNFRKVFYPFGIIDFSPFSSFFAQTKATLRRIADSQP